MERDVVSMHLSATMCSHFVFNHLVWMRSHERKKAWIFRRSRDNMARYLLLRISYIVFAVVTFCMYSH